MTLNLLLLLLVSAPFPLHLPLGVAQLDPGDSVSETDSQTNIATAEKISPSKSFQVRLQLQAERPKGPDILPHWQKALNFPAMDKKQESPAALALLADSLPLSHQGQPLGRGGLCQA